MEVTRAEVASSTPNCCDVISQPSTTETFHGRQKIVISMSKNDFYSGKPEDVIQRIMKYLPYVITIHKQNASDVNYLWNYYRGIQPILNKTKYIRPEINHIVLENHAYEIVEFKKSYIYGEPIQYVQKGETGDETSNDEIALINQYNEVLSKPSEDKQIAEWQYICGVGYRHIGKGNDETPYTLSSPDPRKTFVVYSNSIEEEVLFSGFISEKLPNEMQIPEPNNVYNEKAFLTIYTDKFYLELDAEKVQDVWSFIPKVQNVPYARTLAKDLTYYPLVPEGNRIIEYPLNNARLGLIELVMTGLNAINQIKSNQVDDIDQFVQSLLVFINQEIDPETYKNLIALGAIEVNSQESNKPADVKMLNNALSQAGAETITTDLYNNVLIVCGVPKLNDSSGGGDTGQARLIGGGWVMADARARQDELAFKKAERTALKIMIDISKLTPYSKVSNLSVKDVEVKFTRNKNDNLLTKTQGLLNMKDSQVDPETAFNTCGLFSDANEVFNKAKEYYGESFWKQETVRDTSANLNNVTDNVNIGKNSRKTITTTETKKDEEEVVEEEKENK